MRREPGDEFLLVAVLVSIAETAVTSVRHDVTGGLRWLGTAATGTSEVSLLFVGVAAATRGGAFREGSAWMGCYLTGTSVRGAWFDTSRRQVTRWVVWFGGAAVLRALFLAPCLEPGDRGVAPRDLAVGAAHVLVLVSLIGGSMLAWSAIGWFCRSRMVAVGTAMVIGVVSAAWFHVFTSFHRLTGWWRLTPFGALGLFVSGGSLYGRSVGSVQTTAVVALWAALATAAVRAPLELSRPRGASGPVGRGWAVVALAATFGLGFAVPEMLQHGLAWYQTPTWHLDERRNAAADDVAAEFLDAVQAGQIGRAGGLTVDERSVDEVVGVLSPMLLTLGTPDAVDIVREPSTPGAVTAFWPDGTYVNICLRRDSGAWRIATVSLKPCPQR